MAIIAIMAHLAPLLTDQGLTLPQAAWVVSTYTVSSMIFQVIGGYVGDRIPKNVGLFAFTMVQASALLVLTYATETWMAFAFAVLFGIGFGGRSPLTTSIRGDYFGRRSFGTIMGISQVPMNILSVGRTRLPGIHAGRPGRVHQLAFLILAVLNVPGRHTAVPTRSQAHAAADRPPPRDRAGWRQVQQSFRIRHRRCAPIFGSKQSTLRVRRPAARTTRLKTPCHARLVTARLARIARPVCAVRGHE